MERHLVFGIGSPSDEKELRQGLPLLSGKTIEQYFADKDVLLRRDGPLVVSCHRTLDRALCYAGDIEAMAEQHKVVVVLFGGLSFALPGIMSSHTSTVPIIGVPAYSSSTHGGGLDSATAVYNLPEGTVVAGAPVHYADHPSLDKAVLIAEKILGLDSPKVHLIAPCNHKQTNMMMGVLNPPKGRPDNSIKGVFGIDYLHRTSPSCTEGYEVTMTVSDDNGMLATCDGLSSIALQCMFPKPYAGAPSEAARKEQRYLDFIKTLFTLDHTQNTLYFAKAKNAALFLARCLAQHDPGMRERMLTYQAQQKVDTEDKYKITEEEKQGKRLLCAADFR